jgi:hypothetical protein
MSKSEKEIERKNIEKGLPKCFMDGVCCCQVEDINECIEKLNRPGYKTCPFGVR